VFKEKHEEAYRHYFYSQVYGKPLTKEQAKEYAEAAKKLGLEPMASAENLLRLVSS
jgi:hypothetical protein